ncbi:MerC mercury resistance protein [Thalassoglobus neptunius]|uniref:MerC mercury resistance protein n=1 Tax=Thalassoglobus neptunius TaxID=1938619 RepID=A0A5C5V934_9PLAN|nr:MerC domain-containing protein [Thalassoglobus neptunius]TWT35098.1 MerC mercury resistance protein [Thalassoglobus neptunius]
MTRSLSNLTGLILSVACVIHCMLVLVFISSLSSWGLDWLASLYFHQVLAIVGVTIGIWTLVPGWRLHRRHSVLMWAALGLVVMNYSAFAGGDCCAAVPESSGDEASTACQSSCCQSTVDVNLVDQSSLGSFTTAFSWLWNHPTAFGAACLAWAHCLNGGCTRKCCQRESNVVTTEEVCLDA